MGNASTPGELLSYPLPNIKSVIMAVLRPELRALANIYEEEIAYMRTSIDTQNSLLVKIQGYFAEQSSQIVDRIVKDLELSLAVNTLRTQKIDRVEHNTLVDSVSAHNQILMQIQSMLAEQNTNNIDRIMKELALSLDIIKLKTQKVDRVTHNKLVDNVVVLGNTLSVYVEIVDNMKLLVGGDYEGVDVEDLSSKLDNLQTLVLNLQNNTEIRVDELQVLYNDVMVELEAIRDLVTAP